MLNAKRIITAAEEHVGITDSDPAVAANLERLIASLDRDGGLSAAGQELSHRQFLGEQITRLDAQKWLHDYPAIGAEPITAPVFLMGLPRSGTTYFQYLFDRDPRFRLIRTWQSTMPHPPPGLFPDSVAPRRTAWVESRKNHAGLGIATPDEVAQSVSDWHRNNPKNARGKNDYTLEQWGLDDAEIAEQFSPYSRRFAIPRERDGLARIAA